MGAATSVATSSVRLPTDPVLDQGPAPYSARLQRLQGLEERVKTEAELVCVAISFCFCLFCSPLSVGLLGCILHINVLELSQATACKPAAASPFAPYRWSYCSFVCKGVRASVRNPTANQC